MAYQESLFEPYKGPSAQKNTLPTSAGREPLAARMRPRSLEEIVGQEQILAPGKVLRCSIESCFTIRTVIGIMI